MFKIQSIFSGILWSNMLQAGREHGMLMYCLLFWCNLSLSAVFGPGTEPRDDELHDFWAASRHKEGHLVAPRYGFISEFFVVFFDTL